MVNLAEFFSVLITFNFQPLFLERTVVRISCGLHIFIRGGGRLTINEIKKNHLFLETIKNYFNPKIMISDVVPRYPSGALTRPANGQWGFVYSEEYILIPLLDGDCNKEAWSFVVLEVTFVNFMKLAERRKNPIDIPRR